jgi:signal transduction histidine kinase
MNRRRSFRTRFVLAALVCLLPLVAALLFVVNDSLDQARARAIETEVATATAISKGIADALGENEAVLSELAATDAMRGLDATAAQEALVQFKRARPSVYSVFLIDPAGAVVASGGFDPTPVLPRIQPQVDHALTVAEPSVSGRLALPDGDLDAVVMVIPVWAEGAGSEGGAPVAAIGTLLSVDRLARTFAPLNTIPGTSAVVALVDADGALVTAQAVVQTPAAQIADQLVEPIAASLARVRTTVAYEAPDGRAQIATIVPVEYSAVAWSVVVSANDPSLLAENRASLQRIAVVLGVAILLTLVLAIVFAEVTARPVRRLTRQAIALADGNYTQPMETIGSGEVALLSDAFAEMAERLTSQVGDLEAARAQLAEQAERLRELLRRTVRLQEDERRRIAADIHDAVSPLITGALYETRAIQLSRQNEDGEAPESEETENLAGIARLLGQSMDELHRVIFDLRPPDLDDVGVEAAIERYVHQINRSGLPCTFEVIGEAQRLSPETRLGVYRIVQEALHNSLRHAHADEAVVRIEWGEEVLRVSVRDNGSGFDPDQAPPATSLGLLSMRERAAALGGALSVQSRAGEGTLVLLERPVKTGRGGRGADDGTGMIPVVAPPIALQGNGK